MSSFIHLSDNDKQLSKQSKKQNDASLNNSLGQASVAAIKQYLQLADEQKLDIATICQSIGLDKSLLSDNSQHISGELFSTTYCGLT